MKAIRIIMALLMGVCLLASGALAERVNPFLGSWTMDSSDETDETALEFLEDGVLVIRDGEDEERGVYIWSDDETGTASAQGLSVQMRMDGETLIMIDTDGSEYPMTRFSAPSSGEQAEPVDVTGTWYNDSMHVRLILEPDGSFRLVKRDWQVPGEFALDGEDIQLSSDGFTKRGWIGASGDLLFYDYPGYFTRVDASRLVGIQYVPSMKDAQLALAPHTIVEPHEPPYNLGGWRSGDVVIFPLSVEVAGYYNVELVYSREGETPIDIEIESNGGERVTLELAATGTWERYTQVVSGAIWLTPEDHELAIVDADPVSEWRYVMNLRALRLTAAQSQEP